MTGSAQGLLASVRAAVTPEETDNRLVREIEAGRAPREVIGALAAEELRIVPSDRRSFLTLAARAGEPATADFFTELAKGENLALATLPGMAEAAGLDAAGQRDYRPRAGCQAYPAYLAWLALNADPAEVVVAVSANFAAWGAYCARLSQALRGEYGFDDKGCGFVDFFATPAPELERQALAAIQQGLDAGRALGGAAEFARLLQDYELMFWNTLGELAAG